MKLINLTQTIVIALALLAAACGGKDKQATKAPEPETTGDTPPGDPSAAEPGADQTPAPAESGGW